jgi:hypothetical protein
MVYIAKTNIEEFTVRLFYFKPLQNLLKTRLNLRTTLIENFFEFTLTVSFENACTKFGFQFMLKICRDVAQPVWPK